MCECVRASPSPTLWRSVCVVRGGGGGVYSWGHGEYGQHGGGAALGASDLVDAFHFYRPRRLASGLDHEEGFPNDDDVDDDGDDDDNDDGGGEGNGGGRPRHRDSFVAAACGACFSLGLTARGRVWSWGWNGHGALGHGLPGHFSSAPAPLGRLGPHADMRAVVIACGSNHSICLARTTTAPGGALLRPLLAPALDGPPLREAALALGAGRAATAAAIHRKCCSGVHAASGGGGGSSKCGADGEASDGGGNGSNDGDDGGVDGSGSPFERFGCDVALVCCGRVFPAHRVILAARCNYLRGLLAAAAKGRSEEKEEEEKEEEKKIKADEDDDAVAATLSTEGEPASSSLSAPRPAPPPLPPLAVNLDALGPDASPATAAALLAFLYCDRLVCPPHRVPHLARLADALFLPRLAGLARLHEQEPLGQELLAQEVARARRYACAPRAAAPAGGGEAGVHRPATVPRSTFEADLAAAVGHAPTADLCLFVRPRGAAAGVAADDRAHEDKEGGDGEDDEDDNEEEDDEERDPAAGGVLWAHSALLLRVPYFCSLLCGAFSEGLAATAAADAAVAAELAAVASAAAAAEAAAASGATTSPPMQPPSPPLFPHRSGAVRCVDVTGLSRDGLPLATLSRVAAFAYGAGASAALPPPSDRRAARAVTRLAAAAERLNLPALTAACERRLVGDVGDNAGHAASCAPFAEAFNLRRLARHCAEVSARCRAANANGDGKLDGEVDAKVEVDGECESKDATLGP